MTTSSVENPSKKNFKKTLLVGALAGAVTLTGVMAYFTDRLNTSVGATAGTVDLALDANWEDVTNLNPGDRLDLSYTVQNDGNKSVDVRERIIVKSSVAMDTDNQAQFEVYASSDVEQDTNGAYVPKDGATPVATDADRVVSTDNTSITYNLAEYTLNGTGTGAETEDGITETSKDSSYVLVFDREAKNAFQGASVNVELVAEAKQHRNTDSDTWDVISTDSITAGGEALDVVPEN